MIISASHFLADLFCLPREVERRYSIVVFCNIRRIKNARFSADGTDRPHENLRSRKAKRAAKSIEEEEEEEEEEERGGLSRRREALNLKV